LQQPPDNILIRDLTLDPDKPKESGFDVEALGKKAPDEKIQPRYRLRLWLSATDNNVETGPGVSESKDKFVFLIVSENELIVEINKEEESLHVKLEDTVNKLKDAQAKLELIQTELPTLKPNEFSPLARRTEELLEVLGRSQDVTREVYMDYGKILRELQVNVVRAQIVERVERQIYLPLKDTLSQEFDRTDKSLQALGKMLDEQKKDPVPAATAMKDMKDLIDRLTAVLDAMGELLTINKLIEQLVEIERQEREFSNVMKGQLELKKKELLEKVFGNQANEKKPPEEKKK
jgi:hypothetical protein